MIALAGLATLAFILTGSIVGARLVLLSRRTNGDAERNVGLGLLLICGVAYPFGLLLPVEAAPELLRRVLFGIAMIALAGGAVFITRFVKGVFRPEASWADWVTRINTVCWVGMGGWALWAAVSLTLAEVASPDSARFLARQLLMVALFGWAAVEAGLYWMKLRRRMVLGLAEREVVNRVALWGIAGLMSVLSSGTMTAVGLRGTNPLEDPATLLLTGIGGLISSGALVLAFLPPQSYLAWIRSERA